ncbi:MAG TPA: extensin family protein [Pseudolabrys sp.]|nr:extensin family protein [Pseudolabrys sp.]
MRLLMALLVAGLGCGAAAAEPVPLPRPRPPIWVEPHSFAEAAAGLDLDSSAITDQPTECDKRLSAMAEAEPLPRLIGPQACGGGDMVELHAVLMPDKTRIAVTPAAVLTCAMAESLAGWLREEAAPDAAKLGSPLAGIENYDSYECRSRNRIQGAKLSEHAHGDALDVRAFRLADGRRLELTDPHVDKPLREALRDSACRRFMTVLGPGEPFHESHIHLDVIERRSGYRICQWDVRTPPSVPLPRPRPPEADAGVNHSNKL